MIILAWCWLHRLLCHIPPAPAYTGLLTVRAQPLKGNLQSGERPLGTTIRTHHTISRTISS